MNDSEQPPATMRELVETLIATRARIRDENRPEAIARQHKLGKLTARERIDQLVDAGSFRELGPLALSEGGLSHEDAPGDGMLSGFGRIGGRMVGINANDFSCIGGSIGAVGVLKSTRQLDLCTVHGHPLITLGDGGGHRIQEAFSSRHFASGGGNITRWIDASGWIPLCCVILGPGFAGPANMAALSDFVVAVRGIASLGVAGPALVKAATGTDITKEELGNPDFHADSCGIIDLVVDTELAALDAARRFLSYLPSNAKAPLPIVACEDPADRREEQLLDCVPADLRRGYDVRRVIELIADGGSVFELKPGFAKNMVTALARLDGRPVGIIANQPMHRAGTIDAPACEKGAHFISMCDAFGVPLVYLVDTPGFLIGLEAEKSGLTRRASKLIFELGRATVPRLCVVLRKGYGFAYMAMNGGRAFHADLAVAWPTAQIAAMSVEGGVDIAFKHLYRDAPDPQAKRREIIAAHKANTTWESAAAGFGIDDVIDPRDTRARLIETLRVCAPRRTFDVPPKVHPITPI
jgi:propionyl-CoA carboxylase beta chain